MHDPGPHRLCRLAHNAHLKTSLRTKQRQKKTTTKTNPKTKTKAKAKTKTKTQRVINHPLTPELAALPRAAKGLQVMDSFLLQAKALKAVDFFQRVLNEFEDSMRGFD